MWVKIEGIFGFVFINLKVVIMIVYKIGEVIFVEVLFEGFLKVFIRCKVRVNLYFVLILGFYLEYLEGRFYWVFFRYEKDFVFFKKCGKVNYFLRK